MLAKLQYLKNLARPKRVVRYGILLFFLALAGCGYKAPLELPKFAVVIRQ